MHQRTAGLHVMRRPVVCRSHSHACWPHSQEGMGVLSNPPASLHDDPCSLQPGGTALSACQRAVRAMQMPPHIVMLADLVLAPARLSHCNMHATHKPQLVMGAAGQETAAGVSLKDAVCVGWLPDGCHPALCIRCPADVSDWHSWRCLLSHRRPRHRQALTWPSCCKQPKSAAEQQDSSPSQTTVSGLHISTDILHLAVSAGTLMTGPHLNWHRELHLAY